MSFDAVAYERDFVKPLRGVSALPDDILTRYAITLEMSDGDIQQQLATIRQLWNKQSTGNTTKAQVYKLCRIADDELRRQHDTEMETKKFWEGQQVKRDASAAEAIELVAKHLKENYGSLQVVTQGLLERTASRYNLTASQAHWAAKGADLSVVVALELPSAPPTGKYRDLVASMATSSTTSVPALVHPDGVPFSIVDGGYSAPSNPSLRLDVAAVEARQRELDRKQRSGQLNGQINALRILAEGVRSGLDLCELSLYHLATIAREFIGLGPGFAVGELEKVGVVRRDAAVIVISVMESGGSNSVSEQVSKLLSNGQLSEAFAALNALPPAHPSRPELRGELEEAQRRLQDLLTDTDNALAVPDEVAAAALVRQAALISLDAAEAKLKIVPPAPANNLRIAVDDVRVRLYWESAQGHDDEEPTYVVCRAVGRNPVDITDGTKLHSGSTTSFTDADPPVARELYYSVFATLPDRPASRPRGLRTVVTPPVSEVQSQAGTDYVTLRWRVHPDAEKVLVLRRAAEGPPEAITTNSTGCRVDGIAEGERQSFEIIATYLSADGSILRAKPVHVSATPRAVAHPVHKMRTSAVVLDGRLGARVTWTPVDSAFVQIVRSNTPSPWPIGTCVSSAELSAYGELLIGTRSTSSKEASLEAEIPAGVHYLVPISEGGTGLIAGQPTVFGVAEPVHNLKVTCFASHASVSWEWPTSAQMAELTWLTDDGRDRRQVSRAEYRATGGVHLPLRGTVGRVELRTLLIADGSEFTSPPVSAKIEASIKPTLSYAIALVPSIPGLGPRKRRIIFRSAEGCTGVRVRVEAVSGRIMPTKPGAGQVLLDVPIDLDLNGSVEHVLAVPRTIRPPYWLRCFLVSGHVELRHPPVATLKQA